MHVISLVYRLREFLMIPGHSLIGRTKLEGVKWSQETASPVARNMAILVQQLLVESREEM